MKKAIVLAVVAALTSLLLCACTVGTCDICGESGIVKEREVLGIEVQICDDCAG